ncbi:response regulator transcription factor [Rhodopseudomonas palustris]|uniref:response regulator transcription factor n=1 Tax=Rhodopseudomonas palustris TaxID=1076 RepID=UPI0021F34116|nr:response regulator [Rhodopseudomonas palustris]
MGYAGQSRHTIGGPGLRMRRETILTQGHTICIVDDDDDVRESISSFFRSVGLQVVGFGTAEKCLSSATIDDAACLITDLHMPGMNGLGLHRELLRRGVHVPVIVMTAYSTPEAHAEARHLGAAGFVEKPVDPEILLQNVETILRESSAHDREPDSPETNS